MHVSLAMLGERPEISRADRGVCAVASADLAASAVPQRRWYVLCPVLTVIVCSYNVLCTDVICLPKQPRRCFSSTSARTPRRRSRCALCDLGPR